MLLKPPVVHEVPDRHAARYRDEVGQQAAMAAPPQALRAHHRRGLRPGLRKQLEGDRSLYEILRAGYGIQLAEAEETIETVLADPHDAQLLGVDAGLPLLLLSRHAFDVTGEPVEWAQSWYRGDRYKFVTRLRRTPDR